MAARRGSTKKTNTVTGKAAAAAFERALARLLERPSDGYAALAAPETQEPDWATRRAKESRKSLSALMCKAGLTEDERLAVYRHPEAPALGLDGSLERAKAEK